MGVAAPLPHALLPPRPACELVPGAARPVASCSAGLAALGGCWAEPRWMAGALRCACAVAAACWACAEGEHGAGAAAGSLHQERNQTRGWAGGWPGGEGGGPPRCATAPDAMRCMSAPDQRTCLRCPSRRGTEGLMGSSSSSKPSSASAGRRGGTRGVRQRRAPACSGQPGARTIQHLIQATHDRLMAPPAAGVPCVRVPRPLIAGVARCSRGVARKCLLQVGMCRCAYPPQRRQLRLSGLAGPGAERGQQLKATPDLLRAYVARTPTASPLHVMSSSTHTL